MLDSVIGRLVSGGGFLSICDSDPWRFALLRQFEVESSENGRCIAPLACLLLLLDNYYVFIFRECYIWCCPQLTTFEEEILPTLLTTFEINFCQNLIQLPKDVYNLTSLVTLQVQDCSQIEFRPDDRLPPSLQKFYVLGCPKLEQQLKQECRTDWPILDFILKARMS